MIFKSDESNWENPEQKIKLNGKTFVLITSAGTQDVIFLYWGAASRVQRCGRKKQRWVKSIQFGLKKSPVRVFSFFTRAHGQGFNDLVAKRMGKGYHRTAMV